MIKAICVIGCMLVFSLSLLDCYPIANSDEATYCEPAWNLWTKGKISLSFLPPMGGFAESSLVQHGRILTAFRALIFGLFGVSLFTARIPCFLAGMGLLWLTYLFAFKVFKDQAIALFSAVNLALSHQFFFASHFARPDIFVALCAMGALLLIEKGFYFWAGLTAALAMDMHPSGNWACWVLAGWMVFNLWPARRWILGWIVYRNDLKKNGFVALGMAVGLAWWFGIRLAFNSWAFFKEQAKWNTLYGQVQSPLGLLMDEWHRWYNFFWLGAYHRNMFLLLLFSLAVVHAVKARARPEFKTLLGVLGGSMLGYTFGVPAKGTVYLIYGYPLIIISMSAMIVEGWRKS